MIETWRWFGPEDTVTLEQIVQAGASGIVTALDHIPTGDVWPIQDIQARKSLIESYRKPHYGALLFCVKKRVPLCAGLRGDAPGVRYRQI